MMVGSDRICADLLQLDVICMKRGLVLCLCMSLVLLSTAAMAQMPVEKVSSGTMAELTKRPETATGAYVIQRPDLTVKSARVTGSPVIFRRAVIVPLEITVANLGSGTSEDFNVGAEGRALDGNAYGFDFSGPGYATMEERGGVLVHGMRAGEERTFSGLLMLGPSPLNAQLQPGTKWKIRAMVDYNLDPDAGYYEWGVRESDDSNNELEITYPITAMTGTMMRSPAVPAVQGPALQ